MEKESRVILKNKGDVKILVDTFSCSRVTVHKALRNKTNNSLLAYNIREYAKNKLGAKEIEF